MKLLYSIIYVLLIGAVAHFAGAALPRENIRPDSFPYKCRAWERGGAVYERIGIRRWKDRMPDTSRYSRLLLTKEVHPHMSSGAVRRLIQETCVAEKVHVDLSLASVGVLFIWESSFGFFIWFLCFLGNLPYILIQRYNRPQLVRLLELTERREARGMHSAGYHEEDYPASSAYEVL